MTGAIQIGILGVNTGPFNLYSNVNGFTVPFAVDISRQELINGYATDQVPNTTSEIRIMSTGECTSYVDIYIGSP